MLRTMAAAVGIVRPFQRERARCVGVARGYGRQDARERNQKDCSSSLVAVGLSAGEGWRDRRRRVLDAGDLLEAEDVWRRRCDDCSPKVISSDSLKL